MNMIKTVVYFALTSSIGAISTAQAANCEVESATYGSTRAEMAQKRSGTWVLLNDIEVSENTIGYGPGGATEFEATFYDGKAWLAQQDDGQPNGVLGRHTYAADEGNVFTVTATAETWLEIETPTNISSLTTLNQVLTEAASGLGCETALLPFRVEGVAREVEWSIESNPEKMTGTYHNEPVVLVGIFSSADREGFFAVGDMHIHVHSVFPEQGFAGHVTAVKMEAGSRVFIGQ